MGKRFVAWAAALVVACGGAASAATPNLSKMTSGEVAALARAMPKGGELHNHVSGGIFAETFLAWAVEDGLCIDTKALSLYPPCQAGGDLKLASAVKTDEGLRQAMLDSLSVRHPGFRDRSGHDQFFSAFGRFGVTNPRRDGDMLAEVMNGLARQNTFYLEAMWTPQGFATRAKGSQVGWKGGDLAAQKAANSAAGLEALVPAAIAETDGFEARARTAMKCGAPEAEPGCQVTVRYLVQTNRAGPPEQTFAQLQMGVALVAADKRWVGLQMVAPEDGPAAIANYGLHMRIVDFLTDHGRGAPVALHAGELTLNYVTPAELSYHVADAVRIAGARRIGHGTDLPLEAGAEALAAEMAAKGVLVEVNLSSNAAILGVSGKAHPYAWLRQRGVPVSLSTDDAGILRIDLSHEYARAADDGASYDDLKRSARNAIAFSFLSGAGLWDDPGVYRRAAKACAGQIGGETPKPGACAALVAGSDKAREQWRHERLLKAFEAGLR
jgi:adenosine deaminase